MREENIYKDDNCYIPEKEEKMDFNAFINSDTFTLIIIPILIFCARIIDVSIGTLRLIFISRGYKLWSPILGFFEVLVWLMAIRQIMNNLTNWVNYVAYAGGYATGTFVGMYLEEKISIGKVALRIITKKDPTHLITALEKEGFTNTINDGKGPDGKVEIIQMIINRKDIKKVIEIIEKFNVHAFYSIEDIRYAAETNPHPRKLTHKRLFNGLRKGK
jgi:uncharacterized protein YebE (UPF0316 family)